MTDKIIDYSDCIAYLRESIEVLDRLCAEQPEKREQLRAVIVDLRRQVARLGTRNAPAPRRPVASACRFRTAENAG